MTRPSALEQYRINGVAEAVHLTVDERHALAGEVLALAAIRRATAGTDYWTEVARILHDAAPSLAVELDRTLNTADLFHERITRT